VTDRTQSPPAPPGGGSGYVPGPWTALAAPGAWLFLCARPGEEAVARCWQPMRAGLDAEDTLTAIMRSGLDPVAGFALVHCVHDETRLIVRGHVDARVLFADGTTAPPRAAGNGELTDRRFPGLPTALRLAAPPRDRDQDQDQNTDAGDLDAPGTAAAAAAMLPLECGVAAASVLGYRFEAFAQTARAEVPVEPPTAVVESPEPLAPISVRRVEPAAEPPQENPVEPPSTVDSGEPDLNLDGFLLSTASTVIRAPEPTPAPDISRLSNPPEPDPDPVPVDGPVDEPEPYQGPGPASASTPVAAPVIHEPEPGPFASPGPVPAPPGPMLELDDVSWLGAPAQPEQPTAPPVQPAPRRQPSAGPGSEAGRLPYDAEATTFRPGRAPVQIGGPEQSVILAVPCPAGHPNPPRSGECRVCRLPVPDRAPQAVPRPVLGRLRLSNGEVHLLDRGFRLGRNPTLPTGAAGPRPNLLRLNSADGDVSRNHAEIRLEGWQVVVADLGSMNGTYLTGPGFAPRVLSRGEEQVIEPGCVVTLAHDVWITYEVAE
jgi:FHA domain